MFASHLSFEDRRRRLKAKIECRACRRKGHWANDRECATSASRPSTQDQTRAARMATRQQLSNQANQVGVCFVLNQYSGDPDTSADMVGRNVPLPTEPTEQIPLTPTASAAVNIKNTATFDVRVMDDNDEPWATEADHRTGWNKNVQDWNVSWNAVWNCFARFSETSCIADQSKERLHNHARVSLLAQRNYRTDVTASTVERKTGGLASAGAGPGGCKEFFHKGSNAHSIRLTCERRHPQRQDPAACFHQHTDHSGSNAHMGKTLC